MGETVAKVLLTYDGSEQAKLAIKRAGEILGGGDAVVLTVWEPVAAFAPGGNLVAMDSAYQGPAMELNEIADDVSQQVVAQGVALADEVGFSAVGQTEEGRVWSAIVRVADEHQVDLIVLGSHGSSGVKSALLGSVSNAVAHHTSRPFLVVPSED